MSSAIAQAVDEDVVELLEQGLAERRARPVKVADVSATPMGEASTHPIARLGVTLDDGERLRLVLKRLRGDAQPTDGRREVLVYRTFLAAGGFGAPELYASRYDEERERYWLLLEDVGNCPLYGDEEVLSAAVRLLARLHAAHHGRARQLRAAGCLHEHDAAHYEAIAARARANVQAAGPPPALAARFEALVEPFEELVAALVREPRTLVHGDVTKHNFMVQTGARVRPIDWGSAGVGLGALDVALLVGGWGNGAHSRFLDAYVETFEAHAAGTYDWSRFAVTLARCEILRVLLFGGWSASLVSCEGFVERLVSELDAAWRGLESAG